MKKAEWWRASRFGMVVHWGLYSIPGRGEWLMYCEQTPQSEYEKLAREFNPQRYNPEEWVQLAKSAGMKYVILTTRHHDGFALFDSKVSDFTAPKTAAGRDLVAPFVAACRKHNMRIGLYYSLLDWRHQAYFQGPRKNPNGWKEFIRYIHVQVGELMTQYGKVDILWYDGGWPYSAADWRARELNAMVRKHQPDIMINDRSKMPEDFDTQGEQHVVINSPRDWECCMPLYDFWWGHIPGDRYLKTPRTLVTNLAACAGHGGNYLVSIGPRPDGSVAARDSKILHAVGKWLKRNGASIYGTAAGVSNVSPTPLMTTFGSVTTKPDKIYLHVFYWHKEFTAPDVPFTVKKAFFLQNRAKVNFRQDGRKVYIGNLPHKPVNPYDAVIVLEA
jgi:alpha-L-fucosidase